MRVLTVRQPWASLLIAGVKDIENRTWTASYRGWLWIHSAQRRDETPALVELVGRGIAERIPYLDVRGSIIGAVHVDNVVTGHVSEWAIDGQYHFVVSQARVAPSPVPARGHLNLWTPEPHVQRQLDKMGHPSGWPE